MDVQVQAWILTYERYSDGLVDDGLARDAFGERIPLRFAAVYILPAMKVFRTDRL